MNNSTLNFLLDFAEYDSPLQGSYFINNPSICLQALLAEGYLEPAEAPNKIYHLIDGERYLVHQMMVDGRMRCWCIVGNETVEVNIAVTKFYTLCYTPFAKILKQFLGAEDTDDRKVPNHAWNLGTPDAATDEVHLVRNAGTDDRVKQVMSDYSPEATVYWFGSDPEKKSTPASLCRLSSYLTCVDGKICHMNKLPTSLHMNDEARVSTCPNRIIKRSKGAYEFFYDGQGPAIISMYDYVGAAYLPRILKAGRTGISLLEVTFGGKIAGENISWEDQASHGMKAELSIRRKTKIARYEIELLLQNLMGHIDELEDEGAEEQEIALKKNQCAVLRKLLNEPRSFEDGFSKLRHHVRAACMTALCKKLTKEGLGNLAQHITSKNVIVIGTTCRYQPQEETNWKITL